VECSSQTSRNSEKAVFGKPESEADYQSGRHYEKGLEVQYWSTYA